MAGHSNGCMMAFAMAMKHSDFVAATCCHSGVLLTEAADDYTPTPIWFVFGAKDDIVPFNGTDNFQGLDFDMPSAQAGYDRLSSVNGCNGTNITVFEEGFTQSALGCTNNATIDFVTISDAFHFPFKDVGTTYDTTLAAWNFCSSFELPDEPILD